MIDGDTKYLDDEAMDSVLRQTKKTNSQYNNFINQIQSYEKSLRKISSVLDKK